MQSFAWVDRFYGNKLNPDKIVLLHGGPGAFGYMQTVALELQKQFYVVENCQKMAGNLPATVESNLDLLRAVISDFSREAVFLGHSWGAMLALAYAAQYECRAIILVGCGTFSKKTRQIFEKTLLQRQNENFRKAIAAIKISKKNGNEKLKEMGNLMDNLYRYECDIRGAETHVDALAHQQSWEDMLRLQAAGVYPQAFKNILCPVYMLHGDYDPHPGKLIYAELKEYIPQLQYHEFSQCGHTPWLEKKARQLFYEKIKEIMQNLPHP